MQSQDVVQNAKGVAREKESPSATSRSTSLVDQSSASDFMSIAASLLPVNSGGTSSSATTGGANSGSSGASGSSTGGTGTATVSAYALLAAINKKGLTDPVFYSQHIHARQFYFTAGTAASTQALDNTTNAATVLGGKALIINRREIFTKTNQALLNTKVLPTLGVYGTVTATVLQQVQLLLIADLYPGVPQATGEANWLTAMGVDFTSKTLPKVSAATLGKIDALINSQLEPVYANTEKVIEDVYDQISQSSQMSFEYTADIRKDAGYNNHHGALIFDYGLNPVVNWTLNLSGDYTDRKATTKSSEGGKASTEFQWNIAKPPLSAVPTRSPITFSAAFEGNWMTVQKPQYTGQVKVSFPIATGINFPIAYRYQDRAAQVSQSSSQAILGLSFDVASLARALTGNSQ